MTIYIQTPEHSYTETYFSARPPLDGFYIACAKVSGGKLVYYATTHQDWSRLYLSLYVNDPIVGLKRNDTEKLSITAWNLMIPTRENFDFFQRRQNVTNVDFGLTAWRTVRKNDTLVHEFYAIGTTTGDSDKKTKILQNKFAYLAIKDIVNEFADKI